MKSNVETVKTYTLVLTEEEAAWHRGYMQNPMCDPNNEPLDDSIYRRRFFDAVVGSVPTKRTPQPNIITPM